VSFWLVVAAMWSLPLTLAGGLFAAIWLDGRPGRIANEVFPGMAAQEVRRRAGSPSLVLQDLAPWRPLAERTKGCGPSAPIATAWVYVPFLRDDSIVFFDAQQRVLCVHQGGKIIHIVNVD
jgi:hypothetical protein